MFVDFDRIYVDFDGKCGTFLPIKIFLDFTRKSDDFYKTTIVYYKHMFNCSKNRVAKNTELIGGKKDLHKRLQRLLILCRMKEKSPTFSVKI